MNETKDFIIVANGDFLVKEIIQEAITNKVIIALDGAAKKCRCLHIKPHIILGDFDSLSSADKRIWGIHEKLQAHPYPGLENTLIVPADNQDRTDLVKAIQYCDSQHAKRITIICASGGQLDHHEGAMRALRTEYRKDRPILLHTEQQTLCVAKNEAMTIQGNIGDRCGVIAFPHGAFSSQGLEYDVTDKVLEFGFSDSTCNALKQPRALITVSGEALIVMPPQLQSQRDFMNRSEVERLEMRLRDALMW